MLWNSPVGIPPLRLLALACCVLLSFVTAYAQNPQEEYQRIQKDLRSHQKKLESTKRAERSVLEDLNKTATALSTAEKQLTAQREKIKRIRQKVAVLEADIHSHQEALLLQKSFLKKRLRILQRLTKEKDALLLILSGEDTTEVLRMSRYLRDISIYDYALINKYKESLKDLSEQEQELTALLATLTSEGKRLAELEQSLSVKKQEREKALSSVRKKKSSYEKMIAELKESSNRLFKIIQESERREKELRKKRGARALPGKEEAQEDSGFARLKGTLLWPVKGSVALQYGTQVDPLFNLPIFRSGIHIKAADGSVVKSVHDGKVVFADSFKGYGQLVILSHGGGYHTLYGNLGQIFLKNGAIIKENQSVGEVGESATLGSSGLYFEIRYKGKPLDPQQWLRR